MNWPFRRKAQNQTTVPLEVQEYYQTERRERTGVAWLLAIGTLIITILLAALLFFGGRWIYRALTDGDEQTETTSQTESGTTSNSGTSSTDNGQAGGTDNQSTGTTGTSSTSTDQPSQATPPASTTTPSTTDTATATSTGSTAGASTEDLPNTGPGEVIGAVIAITVAGAITHYALVGRRYQA